MLQVLGVAYPAIIVKNMQESMEFYQRLGLLPLYMEPNRDDIPVKGLQNMHRLFGRAK